VRDLYTIQLRLHILPALGSTRLARLITAEVRAWYANLRGPDGPGASTAAKCYRLVRSILTTAVEDGLISANPAPSRALASSPPTNDRSPPWPRPPSRRRRPPEDAVRLLLAAFVGLRKGELLGGWCLSRA